MSENVIQASFAAGELSPSLFARVDFAKYRSGAAKMRNFFVDYRSGASTRPGTEFIRPGSGQRVRLVRFQQSVKVTYVLEFGNGYLRFITNGSSVVLPAAAINGMTRGPQTFISIVGTMVNGTMVFITGSNVPQLNNRYYSVTGSLGAAAIIMDAVTGANVDSTNWPNWTSGGTVQVVYTIGTPYLVNELPLLKFSQKGSQLNITHPDHPPYILTLISATNWTLAPAVFGATVGAPSMTLLQGAGPGPAYYKYLATAVDDNNQESVAGPPGIINLTQDLRSSVGTNLIEWTAIPGAQFYNVYGASPSYLGQVGDESQVGFMGTSFGNVFFDSNVEPDFSTTPPVFDNPFAGVNPQVSSYFQQRLVYANGGGNLVQRFWCSRVGSPYNFNISAPSQADDAITAELVSLEVNEIKSLIPMPSGLIALTTTGAWQISGGAGGVATQGGPITPTSIVATPQAYVGANDVPPILINYDILFVQAKGSIIRDLTYNIYANIYTGNDISILSSHMFYGHQILEWAYSEEPFKVVWCVREDGVLLSLTILKEQDMYGWAQHDTLGNFISVCSVTEGQLDAVYVAVQRPNPLSPTQTVLMIERLADRTFPFGAEDSWCVDCGLRTVSNTPSFSLTITPPNANNDLVMIADGAVFGPGSVGQIVRVGGGIIEVTLFIDSQHIQGHVLQPITALIPNDPLNRPDIALPGTWSIDTPFTTIYGLDHMEGQKVSVLADGGVVNGLVVQGGSITLPNPATKVVAGYGFQAQLQTMYLDLGNETNTIQGKRKKIAALTVRCKDSRAVKAGRTFNTVTPIKELNRATQMGFPIPLITADERIIMDPLWDVPGQICIQVDDPLPSTVLGVIPEVVVGDTAK